MEKKRFYPYLLNKNIFKPSSRLPHKIHLFGVMVFVNFLSYTNVKIWTIDFAPFYLSGYLCQYTWIYSTLGCFHTSTSFFLPKGFGGRILKMFIFIKFSVKLQIAIINSPYIMGLWFESNSPEDASRKCHLYKHNIKNKMFNRPLLQDQTLQ